MLQNTFFAKQTSNTHVTLRSAEGPEVHTLLSVLILIRAIPGSRKVMPCCRFFARLGVLAILARGLFLLAPALAAEEPTSKPQENTSPGKSQDEVPAVNLLDAVRAGPSRSPPRATATAG